MSSKYPNIILFRPRKAKRQKEKKPQPEEVSIPVPSDLIATDGKTPVTPEIKQRGEEVEIFGGMKLMRDPKTGIDWVERIA